MDHSTLLILGIIAGGTIYIGLPFGRLRNANQALRASLSMMAAGVLLYLLIEIMGSAMGQTSAAIQSAVSGSGSLDTATLFVILLISGFFIGIIGLVMIEQKWMKNSQGTNEKQLSYMIATGIGFHNLSEGLAIGQSAAQGKIGLAIGLVVGFALHNATEGFGIVGPSMNSGKQVPWKSILLLGLIGGGPTFVGTLLGSLWTSTAVSIFVLSIAGGTLVYVLKELFASVRRETAQNLIMTALVLGFGIGWGTEVTTTLAQGGGQSSDSQAGSVREADGDIISSAAAPTIKISKQESQSQVQMANNTTLEKGLKPKILSDGTKQFTLTASEFPWELYPGTVVNAWGYNHQVPGSLIRVKVGDKVSIVLKNQLPQPTTLHLHGLAVPNSVDGVPTMKMNMDGMDMKMGTQEAVEKGGSFVYTFTVTPQMIGTHFYHSHVNDDYQMDKGLHGLLIVDSNQPSKTHYDVDAIYEMESWKVGGSESENVFTLNGKAFPEAPMLNVKKGQKVLIRLVNASAEENHVMHLHGYTFQIVARDGNALAQPESANTVMLGPSQTADIAFTADNPGQWMFHCHIMDHTINPGPNGDGSDKHMADMGGLSTFINVK
ncbi:ZIP zinc transporter [Aneurinibacillus soli]|uniref:Multicopper oxidase mco n=1 Tax=Aneurinibacillus soli TaxID=1500254 RepID=A0A0U5BCE0_9BACL|nr:multicopper oxidase domain-containing protein [Aneurinibacillus soli]PYE61745.1 ZIP zinc transporter [Aneurinibacillus soli]BAU28397.1 Multicopper oxidase mco [Aneurinibacillus soli]